MEVTELDELRTLNLAELMRSRRAARGWSLVQVAKGLDCSVSYVCDIEHDRRGVPPRMAMKAATLFGEDPRLWVAVVLQDRLARDGVPLRVRLE